MIRAARNLPAAAGVVLAIAAGTGVLTASSQEREMGVRQGPETVFDRPVGEIFVELRGAEPTGRNGRVGSELVFWEFALAGSDNAFLVACASLPDVDCDARLALVCPGEARELARDRGEGLVNHVQCREIVLGADVDAAGGCIDRERSESLNVWLVQCL